MYLVRVRVGLRVGGRVWVRVRLRVRLGLRVGARVRVGDAPRSSCRTLVRFVSHSKQSATVDSKQ